MNDAEAERIVRDECRDLPDAITERVLERVRELRNPQKSSVLEQADSLPQPTPPSRPVEKPRPVEKGCLRRKVL